MSLPSHTLLPTLPPSTVSRDGCSGLPVVTSSVQLKRFRRVVGNRFNTSLRVSASVPTLGLYNQCLVRLPASAVKMAAQAGCR